MDRLLQSRIRAVASKVAYCVHCQGCQVECPSGALRINGRVVVDENTCRHCGLCLGITDKGCWAAKSLSVSKEGAPLKGLNRYQHFGLRTEWLETFYQDPDGWWLHSGLGNRQFDAMRTWLKDAEVLQANSLTELGRHLRELGAQSSLGWAVIWVNLVRNSPVCGWYARSVPWGASYTKQELVNALPHTLARSTRANAIQSLILLMRDTPLGSQLGLGEVQLRGRQTDRVQKNGWHSPEPSALLYCLYRYAELRERHSLSLAELYDDAPEGPYAIFGVNRDEVERQLRGMASRWPELILVEMVRDLDNIHLCENIDAVEALIATATESR
jgi:phosphoadenosine phosphosulfate reductase